MSEMAYMSIAASVFWTLLAFIVVCWLLLYAVNPFEWTFLEDIGGGFLSKRPQLSPISAIDVKQAVAIPSSEIPSSISVHIQKTGQTRTLDVKHGVGSKMSEVMEQLEAFPDGHTPLIVFPKKLKYVELAHGKQVRLWDDEKKEEVELIGWPGSLPKLQDARRLAKATANLIGTKGWSFDTICTLSSTAIPLAYSYMFYAERDFNLVACDNITGCFLPESFLENEQGRRVLLLDAIVQTGSHVERAWRALEKAGHFVVGFIAILYNDARSPVMEELPSLRNLFDQGKAVYLISGSEILKQWKELRVQHSGSEGNPSNTEYA